ncbi:uncharacterized protein LOC122657385 [Telopea speciosissima]|uniref:uncharacterized protein LOC122657385 n=1 Tax=Telopea speciosissima TaxID=54955 RepID=UPI001CC465DC|nr:uncharacterized protein LOC122657385 [Telopea speciosissima]
MGNCQAAEAATVVIQHPGNKIERIYWSVSAQQVMSSNPGHYVALLVTSSPSFFPNSQKASATQTPIVRQLKLLRPDDTLHIGQVYRLITFEEVLKEFAAKKCVKLGRLMKETAGDRRKDGGGAVKPPPLPSKSEIPVSVKVEPEVQRPAGSSSGGHRMGRNHGQWRPALQSISEVET